MDRRGAFRSGFGSSGFSSFESRASNDQGDKRASAGPSRNRPRAIGSGLRRITVDSDKPWIPVTKLGRLVKDGKVTSIEEIYRKSIPVLEYEIVDFLLPNLREQVLKILPVQKEVQNGLRTRFRAFVAIGDGDGHVGLGVQCGKRVSTAIRRAIYRAKTAVVPLRRGYWGAKCGTPHTIPYKVKVGFGEVQVTLYPAPRGAGISGPPIIKSLLQLGGIQDCYMSAVNYTTLGPLVKATFHAIQQPFFFDPNDAASRAFPKLSSPKSKEKKGFDEENS